MVQISLETRQEGEAECPEWLDQGRRSLMGSWDNEADEVYHVLLTR